MLNSWKKSTLPMPKRIEDLDLSLEYVQQVQSASKSAKAGKFGSKILLKPMRTDDLLKLFDYEPSPIVTKARKQLWSINKSGDKKKNAQKKANKENVRKSTIPKTSRRTSTVTTKPGDQTLPLIDMEDLEKNPRKLKQSLRIPQAKFVKPGSETKSNSQSKIAIPPKAVGQSKLKRQTLHQTRYGLKPIPEVHKTSVDKTLPEIILTTETESINDILKEMLCRFDKLETLIQEKNQCKKCYPCKCEKTNEPEQESVENNTAIKIIVTNTSESIQQTTDNVTKKVVDHTVSKMIKDNIEDIDIGDIEKITQVSSQIAENVERDTKYENINCVQNLFPLCTNTIEEKSTGDLNAENNFTDETLQNENRIKPTEFTDEKDIDLCTDLTLRNATSECTLPKSHFEQLEDQLRNNSFASLALVDSDDSGSPAFQEFDYEYLLSGKDGDVTEVNTANDNTAKDVIQTYNDLRKSMPILCTPKIYKNNNASLFTPSVQNSHRRLLSRRVQEQLSMLTKKS